MLVCQVSTGERLLCLFLGLTRADVQELQETHRVYDEDSEGLVADVMRVGERFTPNQVEFLTSKHLRVWLQDNELEALQKSCDSPEFTYRELTNEGSEVVLLVVAETVEVLKEKIQGLILAVVTTTQVILDQTPMSSYG